VWGKNVTSGSGKIGTINAGAAMLGGVS